MEMIYEFRFRHSLTPDGAAELNKTIKINPDAYYFSYSYSTTKNGSLLRGQVPVSGTLPILYPFALAMGSFKGTTNGGISIDETWQENDGLVNTVSAMAPSSAPSAQFDTGNITKGVWNIMPTYRGDHMSLQGGLLKTNTDVERLYTEHLHMINAL